MCFFFVVGAFLLRVRGAFFFFAAGARRFFFCCGCAAFVVAGARCVFFAARVCGAVCRALFFAAGMHAACFLLLRVRGAFFFSLTHSLTHSLPAARRAPTAKKHTQQKKNTGSTVHPKA